MSQQSYSEITNSLLKTIGDLPSSIYPPKDDSFLILDAISSLPLQGRRVLDIGTGSGILGLFCAIKGATVTVTDLNALALRKVAEAAGALKVRIEPVQSDLFTNVKGKFDLILFNPPYLPDHDPPFTDDSTDGGIGGVAITARFLADLQYHLEDDGEAFLLLSSLNNAAELLGKHTRFDFHCVAERSFFFEQLKVFRLTLKQSVS